MKNKINFVSTRNLKLNFFSNFKKINTKQILKTFSLGVFGGFLFRNKDTLFSRKIFCEEKNFSQKNLIENKSPFDSNKNIEDKFLDFNMNMNLSIQQKQQEENSVFYLIFNKENSLQVELKEIILEKLNFYLNEKNKNLNLRNKIKVKLIEISEKKKINSLIESCLDNYDIDFENSDNFVGIKKREITDKENNKENHNYISEKLQKLSTSNEPIILIKSGLCLENINALSFTQNDKFDCNKNFNKNISFGLKEKLNNLLLFYYCDNLIEIRQHFKYLENPEHKIILISNEMFTGEKNEKNSKFNFDKITALSLFKAKNTKIIFVNNEKLKEKFNLKGDNLYIYYPPKLPNSMKNVELFMQENNLKQKYEGIDMNKLFNISPMDFTLKFNFFRNEIKINYKDLLENLYKNSKENSNNINSINFSKFNFNKNDRQKLQKLFTFPKRQVRQLANCDKNTFKECWEKPNKNILFVYLPSWAFLKENIFNYILYEANQIFDEIQITTSKNFIKKNQLYDNNQISDDLPQIYLFKTGEKAQKKIHSFSYFSFPKELQNHLKNRHPVYKNSPNVELLTNVTFLNSKNFKEKILDDKNLKEFIIEIEHEGCPSCFMLGKMFDHLSLKFKKHTLHNKIKFFRIDTENDLRFLGDFAATPTYLFCKKNSKGEITFMNELHKPEFIYRIKKYSNYDLNKIRYHPNLYFGFQIYKNKMFLKPDFDPDMDIKDFA